MRRYSMTVGRIIAIPIRLNWSWLAVLSLVIVMLSQVYSSYVSGTVAWFMAVATTLLLSISVVLHELGHALVARHYHLTVRNITLFALGGVAEIDGESLDPIQELLIAIAGPIMSLLLAIICGVIWWRSFSIVPSLLALHMALTNGLMALFNLLPGYPMDGGRILRAVMWFLTDEELPSARIASQIGRVCGWVLIVAGSLYTLNSGDLIGGVWIGVIGYFLTRSATTGYRQLVLQRILNGVSVADLMQRVYHAVAPELPLDQFVGRFVLDQADQGFPVLHQPDIDAPQALLGMMTLRDLRRFTLNEWSFTHVGEAMTPAHRIRVLAPQMAAGEAFRTLVESGEDQLPVIDDNALQGILRRRDLVHYIQMRLARHSA